MTLTMRLSATALIDVRAPATTTPPRTMVQRSKPAMSNLVNEYVHGMLSIITHHHYFLHPTRLANGPGLT